jgi:hypothetical protein
MKQKILFWIPRVMAILAILFMMMFSIDVFEANEPIYRKLLGFVMHNIPVLILIIILLVSWKYEIIGGILFIAFSIAGSIFFRTFSGNPASLVVMVPFLIVGILFIIHHIVFGVTPSKTA